MPIYVEVSINLAQIDRTYHYLVPEELADQVQPGSLVVVPFGKQVVQGVVLAFVDEPDVPDPLPLQASLSDDTVLTPWQFELAQWISQATFAPLGACVGLIIPTGLSQRADTLVSLVDHQGDPGTLGPVQKRIVRLLKERGSLRSGQLDRALPKINWRGSLARLRKAGWVVTQSILPPPRVSSKIVRSAALSIPPESIATLEPQDLGRTEATQQRRMAVVQKLADEPFPTDFSWIYAETRANYADLKYLEEKGLLHFDETEVWRDPLEDLVTGQTAPPTLTPDQHKAWQLIQHELSQPKPRPFLLHGVTGSGKTEIYMRAVAEVLSQGRQALVMVPEISMTPQAVRRFMSRFPNQVGVYHSKLSEGERYDTWRRTRTGDLKVIIGSRSSLFVPFTRLGLIVIDECDNDSYDESERMPFYHAVDTAEAYANICGANLVMGSATPRVTQYFKAQKGEYKLLEMPRRVLAHRNVTVPLAAPDQAGQAPGLLSLELPKISVVDMRRELVEGNSSALSRKLSEQLNKVLDAGQQAILFLNRKGTSTFVFCRACGEAIRCPRDDQPLVYHAHAGLICHICGYRRQMPKACPNCGSRQIRQFGMGTEKLEQLVAEAFPSARLLRWDAESTQGKHDHDLILSHFSAHRADILIGTQMLAKGLDLPLVTLVGIILAEVGLNLPDYRATERTFQVLAQVSGRAGRSALGGRVVLQTYQPDNYVIQAAAEHDFEGFYRQELESRRLLGYPPFNRLVKLVYRGLSETNVERAARELAGILHQEIHALGMKQTDFIGPVPCYYRKLFGQYRWQIILRGPDPLPLLSGLPLRGWQVEVDPPDLL